MTEEDLAAICGLYCGACMLYRASHEKNTEHSAEMRQALAERFQMDASEVQCDGCLGGGRLTPYCRECAMRLCAAEKEGVERCADCDDFPCAIITDFNNDGMRHHVEVLENVNHMRKVGIKHWVEEQEKRWQCPECRTAVDWYAKTCYSCGAAQPRRLLTPPKSQEE